MNFHIGGSDSERYKPSKKSEDPLIILATSVLFLFNRQCRRLPGLTIDIPVRKNEIKKINTLIFEEKIKK